MSGHKWKVPKEDFFKALNQALNDIVQIIRCPEWRKLQTIHDSHSSTITQVSKEHAEIITQLKS